MNVIIIRTTLGNKPRQGVDCNNKRIDLSECAGQSARHPETNTPPASTISEMSMFAVVSTRCHKYSIAYHIFLELIRSPPLPHTRTNKHINVLDDLFWVVFWKERGTKKRKQKKTYQKTSFGSRLWDGGRGEGSPMHFCFLFLIFFCFFQLFWLFSMGHSPKSLLFYFLFFHCLFWFSRWGPPRRISKYVFFCVFQPKGLPKGQMVAMTMNVLKWTPKFGFCFWNIQCNLRIAVIFF